MNNLTNNQVKESLENILATQKGFVFRKPKNEGVVVLLTGGIDSSILSDLFIEWSEANRFYPLYIHRSAKAEPYEIIAARDVVQFLSSKYGERIAPLEEIAAEVPPKKFKDKMNRAKVTITGYKVRNAILINYGVLYGLMLNDLGHNVRTVLIGKVSSDFFSGSRKEDLRAINVQVCLNTDDWRWQIISPAFEKEFIKQLGLKKDLSKTDLVSLAIARNFPLDLTRTCTNSTQFACGKCEECKERLAIFASLNLKDPITYKEVR